MIIGLVPGAMKPYHAGHHYLVSKAISECDRVIIYTTTKDRKSISGSAMKNAWSNLISPMLPSKVEVVFVSSPIGSVFNMLEAANNVVCDDHIYRLYGGTEDANRFRSEYIKRKFPKVADRFVNVAKEEAHKYLRGLGDSPLAKGEWVRTSINSGNYNEFQNFLPEFLKPHAKDYLEILNS